ncbi:ABC transporter ATP-binding protein [Nocardioides malaquae]|uniref:ABC transporter ATP-binding protein n=1 Tax=Nocardioides malaquae TaxID=2773426 RepID=UPI0029D41AB6|nr:ABC transporter ATP-binding protein [Nocardioides malaquae]
MTGIAISQLRFGYHRSWVLDGVDLEVASGDLLAVIGASGCGKSTLLRLMAGFERPAEGTIHLGDTLVAGPGTHVSPDRRQVGIVPQEGALFPHLTVAENIAFGLPRRAPDRRARVAELVALADLVGLEQRMPRELSGGQQQRVALARALAPRPGVVLLDEPFASLDAQTRVNVRAQVAQMLRREGATGVLVTHDRGEALTMADRVAVMVGGRITQVGEPFALYDAPANREVARLLGPASFVPVLERGSGHVTTVLGGHPERSAGPGVDDAAGAVALVRPEQVVVADSGVRTTVRAVDFVGAGVQLLLELPDGQVVEASVSRVRPHVGDTLTVAVDDGVHLLPADSRTP